LKGVKGWCVMEMRVLVNVLVAVVAMLVLVGILLAKGYHRTMGRTEWLLVLVGCVGIVLVLLVMPLPWPLRFF
jgi:hypothetical protein